MADYLSLEDAAAKLGIPTDRLVELRSQGEVRGFRDGASWKFPESEIDRLRDELEDLGAGSGMLVSEPELGSSISSSSSSIIGGDDLLLEDGSGSDLEIGGETVQPGSDGSGGSDVNLVASDSNGSDVVLIASGSDIEIDEGAAVDSDDLNLDDDLMEIDSGDLQLGEPALSQESSKLDLAIEPKEGSTGPIAKKDLPVQEDSASEIDLGGEVDADIDIKSDGDLSFAGTIPDEDSDDAVIGEDSSAMDVLGSDIDLGPVGGASSLEMMDDLGGSGDILKAGSSGADVLSELDLLSAEQQGSGLVTGDSEELLVSSGTNGLDDSSGLGSSLGADVLADIGDDDDDLVIADDDDDLLLDSAGSDISVAGDSGINLMSPSDSGLSLESEPLDLAGSSISALDLGAELAEGGSSGSGSGIAQGDEGSAIDFQSDEEFQLSPSGVGFDAEESGSQVIEVEDSEAIGEAVEFESADFAAADPLGGDVFAEEPVAEGGFVDEDAGVVAIDETSPAPVPSSAPIGSYEIPFTVWQCVSMLAIIGVMCLGGMLMTDLLRNMWTYTEPSSPVSSLTDALIDVAGWGR